ncbi:uncharacterized protein ATNIH1004_002500 [Aspergillus tanneri]|nr:uncharacterized protein ATNIH1004_002500 [Aspergillus tanneri]KAA8649823.1 hypothetical protein ATNIH1004_002500 [Aspergillus tanneri]
MRSAFAAAALFLAVGWPAANAQDLQGCYSDAGSLEDQGSYTYQSDGYCRKLCSDGDYGVFALHAGTHCLCGNKLPADSAKTSDSNCDKECAGWPATKCGGKNAYSIYLTGVKSKVDKDSSSSSSSSTQSGTATTAPSDKSSQAGQTVIKTSTSNAEAATEMNKEDKKDSGPNTAAIAAGVVVGVVGFCALVGAIFFLRRFRNRKATEEQYRHSVGVDNYAAGKPMSQSSMSDSRFDGDFMAQRRQSNGSIDDDQDFSRRILQVTNPDRR